MNCFFLPLGRECSWFDNWREKHAGRLLSFRLLDCICFLVAVSERLFVLGDLGRTEFPSDVLSQQKSVVSVGREIERGPCLVWNRQVSPMRYNSFCYTVQSASSR